MPLAGRTNFACAVRAAIVVLCCGVAVVGMASLARADAGAAGAPPNAPSAAQEQTMQRIGLVVTPEPGWVWMNESAGDTRSFGLRATTERQQADAADATDADAATFIVRSGPVSDFRLADAAPDKQLQGVADRLRDGMLALKATDVEPTQSIVLGGQPALQFAASMPLYFAADGSDRAVRSLTTLAVIDGRFYNVAFTASSAEFQKRLPEARQMLASVRFPNAKPLITAPMVAAPSPTPAPAPIAVAVVTPPTTKPALTPTPSPPPGIARTTPTLMTPATRPAPPIAPTIAMRPAVVPPPTPRPIVPMPMPAPRIAPVIAKAPPATKPAETTVTIAPPPAPPIAEHAPAPPPAPAPAVPATQPTIAAAPPPSTPPASPAPAPAPTVVSSVLPAPPPSVTAAPTPKPEPVVVTRHSSVLELDNTGGGSPSLKPVAAPATQPTRVAVAPAMPRVAPKSTPATAPIASPSAPVPISNATAVAQAPVPPPPPPESVKQPATKPATLTRQALLAMKPAAPPPAPAAPATPASPTAPASPTTAPTGPIAASFSAPATPDPSLARKNYFDLGNNFAVAVPLSWTPGTSSSSRLALVLTGPSATPDRKAPPIFRAQVGGQPQHSLDDFSRDVLKQVTKNRIDSTTMKIDPLKIDGVEARQFTITLEDARGMDIDMKYVIALRAPQSFIFTYLQERGLYDSDEADAIFSSIRFTNKPAAAQTKTQTSRR